MAEKDRARRMEEQERIGIEMSGVEEVSEEERSGERNLKKKEKCKNRLSPERFRIGSEKERELHHSLESEEVNEGMEDSLETKYTSLD